MHQVFGLLASSVGPIPFLPVAYWLLEHPEPSAARWRGTLNNRAVGQVAATLYEPPGGRGTGTRS